MKAVVLADTRQIEVRDVPDAEIKETTDVLMRVTSSAICGTDLHFYEGRMRGIEGGIIGHEPLGVVEKVGSAVLSVKKGDRRHRGADQSCRAHRHRRRLAAQGSAGHRAFAGRGQPGHSLGQALRQERAHHPGAATMTKSGTANYAT